MSKFVNWILKHAYFFWVLYFAVLFVNGIIFLDPDFGWRLRTGQIILSEGLPRTDPYSFTMPSYPWVNHAWLTDTIIASLYSLVGKVGLSFFFTVLIVFSVLISVSIAVPKLNEIFRSKKTKGLNLFYISFPILLLSEAALLRFSGVRAQVWSWFFTAIIVKAIFVKSFWQKFRWFLPVVFALWVNLHGGFAAGIVLLFLYVLYTAYEERKLNFTNVLVFVLCIAATFANPYQAQIYREVWLTISDKTNHAEVMEWNSALRTFDISTLILIALSTILVFVSRKKLSLFKVGIFVILFYGAMSAVRQIPLWASVALPLTAYAILEFFKSLNKNKESERRFHQVYQGFYVLSLSAFLINGAFSFMGMSHFTEGNFYPDKAVSYLRSKNFEGEVFSRYDWGGYLIWKYPEKKVYIDGRMPFWKWDGAPSNETKSAIKDYLDITRGKKDFKSEFTKYNITTVLWLKPKPKDPFSALEDRLYPHFKFFYKLFNYEKNDFDIVSELEKNDWQKEYEDDLAVIYRKDK